MEGKQCQFCGGLESRVEELYDRCAQVVCGKCGASGPVICANDTVDDAVGFWNAISVHEDWRFRY